MDFWIPSLLTLFFLSLTLPGMGAFLLWRRMSFFADALSHACLLGVAVAVVLRMDIFWGMILSAFVFSLGAYGASKQKFLAWDTILSVLAATFFAGALVLASWMRLTLSFEDLLFGDILTATPMTALLSGALAILWGGFYGAFHKPLILSSLSPDLAEIHVPRLAFYEYAFTALLALTIALFIPVVGVILLPALMIIPAAGARCVSRTPAQMLVIGSVIACISSSVGFGLSYVSNLPTSPVMILVSVVILLLLSSLTGLLQKIRGRRTQKLKNSLEEKHV